MHVFVIIHPVLTCPCVFQIDPNSIAAKDGRIREGDRIIQVGQLLTRSLVPEEHTSWLMIIALELKIQKTSRNKDYQIRCIVRPDKLN